MLVGLVVYSGLWLVAVAQILAADGVGTTRKLVGAGVIIAHLVVVAWFVGHRVAHAGVLAGPEDVIIRNPLRSRRLAWDEIERFSVEPAGQWSQGCVRTVSGESIPINGIQGQNRVLFPNGRWAEGPIED
jgi:hypothetical protein